MSLCCMAPKRKISVLSDDEAISNRNATSSPPIIHESVACQDKASSDTVADVSASRRAVLRISSSHSYVDEQSHHLSSTPPISSSTLPPDDLPSPHTAKQPTGQVEPTIPDVSPPAAIKVSRSSPRTSFERTDHPTVPIQATNDSTATFINSQRLPLTKQNLRIFTGADMADNPVTPSRSASNTGPGTMNSQKATNVRNVHMVLRANGMPIEEPNIKRSYPQVHELATAIVSSERHSPVKPGWNEKFATQRNKYATRNEITWTVKLWAVLQNHERNVRKGNGQSSLLSKESWEAIAWEKSGLDNNLDLLFHVGSLPRMDNMDGNELALLESLPRVKTPKPDIAFGLDEALFDEVEITVNDRYHQYVQVSEGIYHPWFLVETKTNGTIEEVKIQCCRGGAALVRCARQLIEDSDPKAFAAKYGPDLESIAFSLALVPTYAQIHYHWANRNVDGRVVYHMHLVKSFDLLDEARCVALQHDVNNILDWGLGARQLSVRKTLAKIHSLVKSKGPKSRKRAKSARGYQSQSSRRRGKDKEDEEDEEDEEEEDDEDDEDELAS